MTLGMWLYLFFMVFLGTFLGLVVYSIQNKLTLKKTIWIKWQVEKMRFKHFWKGRL